MECDIFYLLLLLLVIQVKQNEALPVASTVTPANIVTGNYTFPTQPTSKLDLLTKWSNWKSVHGKSYTQDKEIYRRDVWLANQMYIDTHNSQDKGYTLAMNHFGDLTHGEWKEMYLSPQKPFNFTTSTNVIKRLSSKLHTPSSPFPPMVDWRGKNAVSPVKNQGKCDASYAFGAVGALEGAASLAQDKLVTLSEQNILDCSIPYGNHGCQGGSVDNAFKYIISVGSLDTEETYPYISKQGTCQYKKEASGGSMTGVIKLASGSEQELLAAVATVGPVAINIDASSNSFRFYSGGVFRSMHCSPTNLNHAMVLTGYGATKKKQKYWLVKNSWGENWGDSGYVMIARENYNQCGIATDASYPAH